MADYESMTILQKEEKQGTDWEKDCSKRDSVILVVAPHGGTIEPHTELIAKAIAGDTFSVFSFVGLRRNIAERRWLHVASIRYDEIDLRRLLATSELALSVYGAANRDGFDDKVTFMGGANTKVKESIWARLEGRGFNAFSSPPGLDGSHPRNFVNMCGPKEDRPGVQLEISRSERDALADNPVRLERYASAIREILFEFHNQAKG